MSTDNVTPIRPVDGDSEAPKKYDIICRIDCARGIVAIASDRLIEGGADAGLASHVACALALANEELQRVRDEVESL